MAGRRPRQTRGLPLLSVRPGGRSAVGVTPNGDDVNDEIEIRFVAFKVENGTPQIQIFDLAGRPVAQLATPTVQGVTYAFIWSGRDVDGNLVAPGAYLLRIDLRTDAGEDTILRTIAVAY